MATRLQTKGEHSRELILQAAAALIAERGFNAITLQDILEAAGVTKGRFFHCFSSKDDLFSELLRNALQARATAKHSESLAECSAAPPFEKLLFLLDRTIAWHSHGLPDEMRLCLFATFFFPPDSPEIQGIHARLSSNAEVIESLIAECQASGSLPPQLNPKTLSLLFPSAGVGGNIIGHLCDFARLTHENIVELRKVLVLLNETCAEPKAGSRR